MTRKNSPLLLYILCLSILIFPGAVYAATRIWDAQQQTGSSPLSTGLPAAYSYRVYLYEAQVSNGQWYNISVCFWSAAGGSAGTTLSGVHICEKASSFDCATSTMSYFPDIALPAADQLNCVNLIDTNYAVNGSKDYLVGYYINSSNGKMKYWGGVAGVQGYVADSNVTSQEAWTLSGTNSFLIGVANLSGDTPTVDASSLPFRQDINLTVSSGTTSSNYQVRLNVSYDSDMQTDFDDARFLDNDGTTTLSYWLEQKSNSGWAVFWVKVNDTISTSGTTIVMRYGNNSIGSASNGENTFLLYDNFDDFSLNSSMWENYWNYGAGCSVSTESGTTLTLTTTSGAGCGLRSSVWSVPVSFTANVSFTDMYDYFGFGIGANPTASANCKGIFIRTSILYGSETDSSGNYQQYEIENPYAAGHHYASVKKGSAGESNYYLSNVRINGSYAKNDTANSNFVMVVYHLGSMIVDYVFVHNYHDPEPTASFGSEQGGNDAPSIDDVKTNSEDAPSINPVEAGNAIATVEFNVTDGDGTADINLDAAYVNDTTDSIANDSCAWSDYESGNTKEVKCELTIPYYTIGGAKSLTVYIEDDSAATDSDSAHGFTLNTIYVISLNDSTIDFGDSLLGGSENNAAAMRITNTGNGIVNVSIKGSDMEDAEEDILGTDNCTIDDDATADEAEETGKDELALTANAQDYSPTTGITTQDTLDWWYFLDIPALQPAGTYTSTANWEVTSSQH